MSAGFVPSQPVRPAVLALLLCLLWPPAQAQEPHRPFSQWVPEPDMTLKDYLADGGRIVAAAGLSWPDGRPAVVVYVEARDETFRCVDMYDASFQSTGFMCYRLVAFKKPFTP